MSLSPSSILHVKNSHTHLPSPLQHLFFSFFRTHIARNRGIMIKMLNPYSTAKMAEIMSRYKPIAPKLEALTDPSRSTNSPSMISQKTATDSSASMSLPSSTLANRHLTIHWVIPASSVTRSTCTTSTRMAWSLPVSSIWCWSDWERSARSLIVSRWSVQ